MAMKCKCAGGKVVTVRPKKAAAKKASPKKATVKKAASTKEGANKVKSAASKRMSRVATKKAKKAAAGGCKCSEAK